MIADIKIAMLRPFLLVLLFLGMGQLIWAQTEVKTQVNEKEIVVILDGDDANEKRGYLGALVKNGTQGVLVQSFNENSPAELAGLAIGDEIIKLNQLNVRIMDELIEKLQQYKPGDEIQLTVLRNGVEQMISVTLGKIE